jgi:hypothetical protein
MLGCFVFHAVDWEFGFDSAVDTLEGVEDEAVECVVQAFEHVVDFCEEVQSGFCQKVTQQMAYSGWSGSITLLDSRFAR